MAFDITQLNQSSFRAIPFYTRDDDLSGGLRLTDHKFINGGTKTESNGIENDTFKIIGYIGGENYLTQKAALREAFKNPNSGTLIDKFYGNQEVFVEKWNIKESITKFGQATIEVSFRLAENNLTEDVEIVYNTDVREEAISNFKNDFNNNIGQDLMNEVAKNITGFLQSSLEPIKFLDSENQNVKNIKSTVGRIISNVKSNVFNVNSLADDIQSTWTAFDEIGLINTFDAKDQKSFTNNLKDQAQQTQSVESQNIAEETINKQTKIYILAVIAGLNQTGINKLEDISFETGDDFGSVKNDILTIMEILEADIVYESENRIDEIIFKQSLLDKYHQSKRDFIEFYTQKYSGLQNLKDNEIIATTNVLNLTIVKYNDINRINEVLINNDIVDPLFINGKLKLLDR